MSNLLDQALSKQPVANQKIAPAFTFDSEGKVQPMNPKGHLLPSKIFGSPIEYAKDIKKDIVNIKKASNGKANDHELGRINDLGIKIGSLAIAAYLCVKNPLKLDKTMQFAGFASFFASMALLPKLLIQLPLKLRTGVDIHQKYVDSQGRKKMLYQDPQYDLTDLYSQEDLDKLGKKLNVSENLPDRNNFIKQRAKKVGVQGNTLWMMTAGAAPIFSALMCNAAEKPLNKAIEKFDIVSTTKGLASRLNLESNISEYQNTDKRNIIEKLNEKLFNKSMKDFIKSNKDKPLDEKMAKTIAQKYGKRINSADIQSAVEKEILAMNTSGKINMTFIKNALKGTVKPEVFESLSEEQLKMINNAIENNSFKGIAEVISKATGASKREQVKVANKIISTLQTSKNQADVAKLGEVIKPLEGLHEAMSDFAHNKNLLDKYISARIGDKSGTYIANIWDDFTSSALKSLKLNNKELKELSNGNLELLESKLQELVKDEGAYTKTVKKLLSIIKDYESKTGEEFTKTISDESKKICRSAKQGFKKQGLHTIAQRITGPSDAKSAAEMIGTLENTINKNAKERITGAGSSFYRLMQALDIFKKANNNTLTEEIKTILKEQTNKAGSEMADDALEASAKKLVEVCKKVVLNATTTDYVEKLSTAGYELSEIEYKTVMSAIFNNTAQTTLENAAKTETKTNIINGIINKVKSKLHSTQNATKENTKEVLDGFKKYKQEAREKIANWRNPITPELGKRVLDTATNSADAIERNNLAGKPIKSMAQDAAKKMYNSKKWLKIWGTLGIVIAAGTIAAGLFLGKKGKIEKEAEAKNTSND